MTVSTLWIFFLLDNFPVATNYKPEEIWSKSHLKGACLKCYWGQTER